MSLAPPVGPQRDRSVPPVSRPRLAFLSYIALMTVVVGSLVLVVLFPATAVLQTLLGLAFVLLGVQLAYFRDEHAGIWERWGEPSSAIFAFMGMLFVVVGFVFVF